MSDAPPDWFTREPVTGLCPQCGAGWTGSPCPACGFVPPVPVDVQGRPFVPSPAPRNEAGHPEYWLWQHDETGRWQVTDMLVSPGKRYAMVGRLVLAAAPRADPPRVDVVAMLRHMVNGGATSLPVAERIIAAVQATECYCLDDGERFVRCDFCDFAAARAPGREP